MVRPRSSPPPAERWRNCRRGSFILNLPFHVAQSPRWRSRLWPLCVRAPWQAHGEHRAFAVLARHSHVATHHARELARDGEAETGAAETLRGRDIGLSELLEQL